MIGFLLGCIFYAFVTYSARKGADARVREAAEERSKFLALTAEAGRVLEAREAQFREAYAKLQAWHDALKDGQEALDAARRTPPVDPSTAEHDAIATGLADMLREMTPDERRGCT